MKSDYLYENVNESAELWKVCRRFPLYEVSSQGRLRRYHPEWKNKATNILRPAKCTDGYLRTKFRIEGKDVSIRMHSLVAEAFIGPCPEGKEVNHINSNKADNRACNLGYTSHSQNMKHAWNSARRDGILYQDNSNRVTKLTEDDVRHIRSEVKNGISYRAIARKYNVNKATIMSIHKGKTWKWLT